MDSTVAGNKKVCLFVYLIVSFVKELKLSEVFLVSYNNKQT